MKNTKNKIIEFFKNNNDLFCDCVEELNDYDEFLYDDRYYEMESLNEFFAGKEPIEIIDRAFYGYDDSFTTNEKGEYIYKEFNPRRNYFKFNEYGNLVSSNRRDYAWRLNDDLIEELKENKEWISSIVNNPELKEMFDELEK